MIGAAMTTEGKDGALPPEMAGVVNGMYERGEIIDRPRAWEEAGADSRNLPASRYADIAMYTSEPMPETARNAIGGVQPTVILLNATPDPLGSLAALCGIYEGRVFRSLYDVSDADRQAALEAMLATTLDGPLEAIQFHFLIEGVTRAFTHQAVRNRFSFFAQESMRFAVLDGEPWVDRTAYPPSLARQPEELVDYRYSGPEALQYALMRDAWDDAIIAAENSYNHLIQAGVPAEDARGLMPHSMTTRYHWIVSLRTLLGEAGKRLCTQAQFEWRVVMSELARALRMYEGGAYVAGGGDPDNRDAIGSDAWQYAAMADLLKPICYTEGKCGFMAKFDRGCKIRERVNANASINRPSRDWSEPSTFYKDSDLNVAGLIIPAIKPEEWLLDPNAARVAPEGA